MSKTLSEVRVEIDSIDNQVHDLLMRRADLVSSVAAAKKKEGLQIVQPAREARMVRRLLSRHEGPLPRATVIRIWRELVGSVALLQTGFSVAVADSGENDCSYWDMAKNYFGDVVPMTSVQGEQSTITKIREEEDSFAVIPWPELKSAAPWWTQLLHQSEEQGPLSIICALPYGHNQKDEQDVFKRAVVISKIEFMPSDEDRSFIGLEYQGEVSRSKIAECAQKVGFEGVGLYTGGDAHLIEVEGYFTNESPEISALKTALGEHCTYCVALGGYPVIPDIRYTPE